MESCLDLTEESQSCSNSAVRQDSDLFHVIVEEENNVIINTVMDPVCQRRRKGSASCIYHPRPPGERAGNSSLYNLHSQRSKSCLVLRHACSFVMVFQKVNPCSTSLFQSTQSIRMKCEILLCICIFSDEDAQKEVKNKHFLEEVNKRTCSSTNQMWSTKNLVKVMFFYYPVFL